MSSARIAVFGCKATTWSLLRSLRLPLPVSHLVTIDPSLAARNEVADYLDLQVLASQHGIAVHHMRSYSLKDAADAAQIHELGIDLAFVIGWQRLIPQEILASFSIGAFGMHGSSMDLPLGRGRSPMNWALLEGRSVFYTNLFRYDPGVDSGDVVGTLKFGIGPRDTAETMHFKNLMAMKQLIESNIDALLSGAIPLTPQDASVVATYYPKRSPGDGLIDFGNDVHALDRFIRAVTRPFSGAFSFVDQQRITILDAQVFDQQDFGYERAIPGTVVMVFSGGKFLLKCIGGLLLVNTWEAEFAIEAGMTLRSDASRIRVFPRNRQGNHDLEEG